MGGAQAVGPGVTATDDHHLPPAGADGRLGYRPTGVALAAAAATARLDSGRYSMA